MKIVCSRCAKKLSECHCPPLVGRLGPLETMGRKAGPHQDKRRPPRISRKIALKQELDMAGPTE